MHHWVHLLSLLSQKKEKKKEGSLTFTVVNCFKLWFQYIRYTFESLGWDGGLKGLGIVGSAN